MENTDAVPPQREIKKETLYISEVAMPVEVTSGKYVSFLDWLKRLGVNLKQKSVASDATILENKNTEGEVVYVMTIVPGAEYGNLRVEADAQKQTQQDFLKEGETATPYYLRKPELAVPLQTAKSVWKLSESKDVLSPTNKA